METIFSSNSHVDTVEFSNSSLEDNNYAKLFWKSINSPSIMESKLNPNDAKQLLKVAGPSERKEALIFPAANEIQNSYFYHEKIRKLEDADRREYMEQRKQKIEQIRKASKVNNAKVPADQPLSDSKKAQSSSARKAVESEQANLPNRTQTTVTGSRSESLKFELHSEQPVDRKEQPQHLRTNEDQLECEVGFNDREDVRNLP